LPITSKIRFEIRLPIYYSDGITEVEPETDEVFVELMGGYFVDVNKEQLDEALEFLRGYKEILKERFKQEEIYIVGYELYVI
jgi:hypothetical protein